MKATITRIFSAMTNKHGNIQISAQAITAGTALGGLGKGIEKKSLVNITVAELDPSLDAYLTPDPDAEGRYLATEAAEVLEIPVTFRSFREHAEKENVYWAD